MRMCRGFLRAAKVEDADAGGARPRGSSSIVSDGEVGVIGSGDSGVAEIDGARAGADGAVAVVLLVGPLVDAMVVVSI